MSQSQKNEKSDEKSQNNQSHDSTNQYQIRPAIGKSFPIASIREIINEVLLQILDGKEYSSNDVAEWCRQIVNGINRRVKELEIQRYRHVVQIMLAEQTGAGCRYVARCHWDASCDSKISNIGKVAGRPIGKVKHHSARLELRWVTASASQNNKKKTIPAVKLSIANYKKNK